MIWSRKLTRYTQIWIVHKSSLEILFCCLPILISSHVTISLKHLSSVNLYTRIAHVISFSLNEFCRVLSWYVYTRSVDACVTSFCVSMPFRWTHWKLFRLKDETLHIIGRFCWQRSRDRIFKSQIKFEVTTLVLRFLNNFRLLLSLLIFVCLFIFDNSDKRL